MIPVLTYIAHTNPLNTLKQPQLPCFGSFLYPKNKREIPKLCLTIPKIMPEDPKKDA